MHHTCVTHACKCKHRFYLYLCFPVVFKRIHYSLHPADTLHPTCSRATEELLNVCGKLRNEYYLSRVLSWPEILFCLVNLKLLRSLKIVAKAAKLIRQHLQSTDCAFVYVRLNTQFSLTVIFSIYHLSFYHSLFF